MALDHALPRNDQKFGLSFVKLKAASTECNPRWIGFLYQHPCSLSFQPCCYYGVSTQSAGRLSASCTSGIPCLVEMTKSSRNAVHLVPVGPVLRGMPSHVQRDNSRLLHKKNSASVCQGDAHVATPSSINGIGSMKVLEALRATSSKASVTTLSWFHLCLA